MTPQLPPLRLTGATILRDGELQRRSLAFAEGRLVRGPLPEVDLSGYLLLPGIVDLHGDGFERHMAPRPTVRFPMAAGLGSFDREAAAHGVTTAYLAQGWSWEGGHRGPDHAEEVMQALEDYRPRALTDLRLQIRAETHLVEAAPRLLAAVRRHRIGYVVFNDHLAEGQHMARISPVDFAAWARKVGRTAEDMAEVIEAAALRGKEVPKTLRAMAEAFDAMGVVYGSHDDADEDMRETFAAIGARIAEFPLTRRVAEVAQAMMSPVIMAAPNVVRGKSQAGNVSAAELAAAGLCDALVSDCHVPALPLAVWALVDRHGMGLAEAWALVSTGPAEILRLQDRGRLDPGRRADIAVVNEATRVIEATICGGRLAYLAGEAALRFMAQSATGLVEAEPVAAE